MKTKFIFFVLAFLPFVVTAQGFSGPPSMNRANGMNTMMMQQQQMMQMLMRNIENDEQKLSKEILKKQNLESKIQVLKQNETSLNDQISKFDISNSSNEDLLSQNEKLKKEVSKISSKIEKNEEKLKRSNVAIDVLQKQIEISKIELEEKKKEKEAKKEAKKIKKTSKD